KDMEQDLTTADIAEGNRADESEAEGEQHDMNAQQRREPVDIGSARSQGAGRSGGDTTPLFPDNELGDLKTRWDRIQAGFVDEPRKAVEEADSLVAAAMKRLAEVFAQDRSK